MAGRLPSFRVTAPGEVIAHGSYRMYKDSLKVSDQWHIIKGENRAYDLSGQEYRQENEDSLFLIGQPEVDIILKKKIWEEKSQNERQQVLGLSRPMLTKKWLIEI